ncbi:MAG: HEPN domain-containing protein [Candidatus Omnitrophica bacterium]|nr:HEPN domain-containing protein [Candidatus Omnitrophota bacterium]
MRNHRKDLVVYRISDSKEKLLSAEILFKNKQFKDSVSRSYYAMFSATRALLATKKLDSSKHSGVISLFNQHFVKKEIVSKKAGRILMDAREVREEGDYGDLIIISKKEAERQLKQAKEFIKEIEKAIKNAKH